MNLKLKICLTAATVLVVASSLVGCGNQMTEQMPNETFYAANTKESPVSADPQGAIEAIYKDKGYSAKEITGDLLIKLANVRKEDVVETYGRYSDAKSTLADIIIVKPLPGTRDDVREQLYAYKKNRAKEFENYDILSANSIAKGAVIYDQGEYLVMLMLKDNDAAQGIVDKHIPQ